MFKITKLYFCGILFAGLLYAFETRAQEVISIDSLGFHPELAPPDIITLTDSDIDDGIETNDVSALLSSSGDVFSSLVGYNLGSFRFNARGYKSEYANVFINGLGVNDMETGSVFWSSWGGLNDAVRNQTQINGIGISDFGFGGFGGSTNIQMRASSYTRQVKGVYSSTNGGWRNRIMLTASTGEMDNGLSIAASLSKRWAQEGYVDGTFYDSYGFMISAEQQIAPKHALGFVVFGSPTVRGRSSWNTQEAIDLTGNSYYNSYWGYQNGEKRNSNVSTYNQPRFILSYYWDINEKSKLQANASYFFGRGGSTALNWASGNDPRPDYYRNLPSYYDPTDPLYEHYMNIWTDDDDAGRQLNWDAFYFANTNQLFTQDSVNGTNQSVTGNFSKIILEERRTDINQFGGNILYNNELSKNIDFTAGLDVYIHRSNNFKLVDDLLGGEYWLDIDKFAEGDPAVNSDYYQSDLQNPNHVVVEGDIFGYQYLSRINQTHAFAQANFNYRKWDFFLSGKAGFTEFWRDGLMEKGTFPGSQSYGKSETKDFFEYALKGGGTWKITGRHYLELNAMTMANAPTFRNAFVSPRTRNNILEDLRSEKINGFEANYHIRYAKFKMRLGYYLTNFVDGTWSRSFYHDELNSFVNYGMVGVDHLNQGGEIGFEWEIFPGFSTKVAGAYGKYTYTDKATATVSRDNDAMVYGDRTVYLEGYHVGGMPETAGTFGLEYRGKQYYWIGIDCNVFGNFYEELNPDRHTQEAVGSFDLNDPRRALILDQRKINNGFTLNANIGKSFRFNYKYFLVINLSADNILNTKDIAIGAYEQLRYDVTNINEFAPKYSYLYGAQYFLNVSFRF